MEAIREIKTLQGLLDELNESLEGIGALQDFAGRMDLKAAAEMIGVKPTVIRGAIERGEIEYVVVPGTARKTVTPCALRDWIRDWCVHRNELMTA